MGLIMDQSLTMRSGDNIINILHGVSEVKSTESPLCLEMFSGVKYTQKVNNSIILLLPITILFD